MILTVFCSNNVKCVVLEKKVSEKMFLFFVAVSDGSYFVKTRLPSKQENDLSHIGV